MSTNVKRLLGKDVKVSVENLDRYISQQGVIIRISIGGGRNSYRVSPKIYGIKEEKLTEEGKEFINDHVRNGTIVFIPRVFKEKLNNIESKVRGKLRELAVGYDNSFIPLSSYPEFKEYFDKQKRDFFEIRDKLTEKYEPMCNRFVTIAKQSLKDLNAGEAEKELEKIISKLPSKERFKNSFRFEMAVSAFPTMENITLFDDENIIKDIKETSTKNSNNLVIDTTTNIINEGLVSLSAVIKSAINTGKIHQRSMYGLKNSIRKMEAKNIFANQKLDKIKNKMTQIPLTDNDSAIELSEKLLAELYCYSAELKIEDSIVLKNCLLSEQIIMDIIDIYKPTNIGA